MWWLLCDRFRLLFLQDNPQHPESEIYHLVHESEFDTLKSLYGAANVPHLNVQYLQQSVEDNKQDQQSDQQPSIPLKPSLQTSSLQIQYNYGGSAIPCPKCVRAYRFATGGVADFEDVPLRLKVGVRQ